MLSKYNRLRQGYEKINPMYRQNWLNIKTHIPYEKAYKYIQNEGIVEEISYLSYFLESFKVVTYEQIRNYMKLGGFNIYNMNLEELVDYGFLNNFTISLEGAIEFNSNEIFYSIGANMSLFLRKYFESPVSRMLVRDISLSPAKLINRFNLVDFYLNYISSYGANSIINIELNPRRRTTSDLINIDAELRVKNNGQEKHLIILNVSADTVNTLLPKTITKLEKFLRWNNETEYKRINCENIELVLLCENQEILEYAAKKMVVTTFAKELKLNLLSIDYLLRIKLSEYNIAYSVDRLGNVIEKTFI